MIRTVQKRMMLTWILAGIILSKSGKTENKTNKELLYTSGKVLPELRPGISHWFVTAVLSHALPNASKDDVINSKQVSMAAWRQKHSCVTKATPPLPGVSPCPGRSQRGMLLHQLPLLLPQESPWGHCGKQQPKAAGQSWADTA